MVAVFVLFQHLRPNLIPSLIKLGFFLIKTFQSPFTLFISPSILPYVISLDHCAEIWDTLSQHHQSTTRSCIIQLKNEFHHISMKDHNMTLYLLKIKSKVDVIASTKPPLDLKDIILYILNNPPSQYQAFNTAIHTYFQPILSDNLYTLLCSEEQNIA